MFWCFIPAVEQRNLPKNNISVYSYLLSMKQKDLLWAISWILVSVNLAGKWLFTGSCRRFDFLRSFWILAKLRRLSTEISWHWTSGVSKIFWLHSNLLRWWTCNLMGGRIRFVVFVVYTTGICFTQRDMYLHREFQVLKYFSSQLSVSFDANLFFTCYLCSTNTCTLDSCFKVSCDPQFAWCSLISEHVWRNTAPWRL